MSDNPGPVLITGASGGVGRWLVPRLAALGWELRLTDIAAFPDVLPARARFILADLEDEAAVCAVMAGCEMVVHLGGVSTEQPFATVLGPNLRGLHHIYEAARRSGARVVFASSNHAVGMYPRSTALDHDCLLRPDGFYGLSKAYGEMMGRLYWEKHGVETVVVRIGTVLPAPIDARHLSTWLSPDDLARLIGCAATAPAVGYAVIWGASCNSRSFWRDDDRARIGWAPRDSADPAIAALGEQVSDDPNAEHYQGGAFAAQNLTRPDRAAEAMFPASSNSEVQSARDEML